MPSVLLIVALVCPAALGIEACEPRVALDVVSRPSSSALPAMCLREGEVLLAGGQLGADRPAGTIVKVRCAPRR